MRRGRREGWRLSIPIFLCIFVIFVSLLYLLGKSSTDNKSIKGRISETREDQRDGIVRKGKVAIVVDDLGYSIAEAEALMKMNVPLTYAVLPSAPLSSLIARKATSLKGEVIIHLPMEPWTFPEGYERDGVLLLEMDDGDLVERISEEFSLIPGAKGVSNHMGSKFTEDEHKMRIVLNECKRRGFYFLDSKTTSRSMAYKIAKELNVKSAVRDVFIDHERNTDFIKKQLDLLTEIAIKRGKAVGICHPYPETIKALEHYIEKSRKNGIEFVLLSEIAQ